MGEMERTIGESVPAKIKKKFMVRAGFGTSGEVRRVAGKEGFGEKEYSKEEGYSGADGSDPVIPLPP